MSRFKLPQTITYWLDNGKTGTGGKVWVAGAVINARIAETSEIVFTPEGKQVMATKAVYTKVALPLGTYIVEGDHNKVASPEGIAGTQLVIKASSNSSMTDMKRALL